MSYTYADRKRSKDASPEKEAAQAQPSMDALRSGASLPTQEQMGHRVDLPDAMRVKMENAFGADLGAVKLYESQAVADAGAKAVTRGSDIAFAPGMLDFTSYGGQALLGHEYIGTTEIYTHIDTTLLRKEILEHHPRNMKHGGGVP